MSEQCDARVDDPGLRTSHPSCVTESVPHPTFHACASHAHAEVGIIILVRPARLTIHRKTASMQTAFKHPSRVLAALVPIFVAGAAFAGEADLQLPDVSAVTFGNGMTGKFLLLGGLVISVIGALFGVVQYKQTVALPAHKSMLSVSNIIWETCKSYMWQQGKFLAVLWILIAGAILFYFGYLEHKSARDLAVILMSSVLGILGSYGVSWFGIRINTQANSRTAFASLKGFPLPVLSIPLQSGMSIGMLLVSVELFFMICILMFLPSELVGPSFIGFAIGESLGASALRICGGIFTKIADIGADLMKIVFKLPEDDPKNPGVIADCTGDNAGDSV